MDFPCGGSRLFAGASRSRHGLYQRSRCQAGRKGKGVTCVSACRRTRATLRGKNYLGALYQSGNGVRAKRQGSRPRLWRLSADQGNADAQKQSRRNVFDRARRSGQDYKEAARLLALSAAQDHAAAQTLLGNAYADGRGLLKDRKRSHKEVVVIGGLPRANRWPSTILASRTFQVPTFPKTCHVLESIFVPQRTKGIQMHNSSTVLCSNREQVELADAKGALQILWKLARPAKIIVTRRPNFRADLSCGKNRHTGRRAGGKVCPGLCKARKCGRTGRHWSIS